MSGGRSRLLGRWGEAQAAEYLRRRGYRLVAAGWSCRYGEIDLIVQGKGALCFVEVKLRQSRDFGTGAEYVDGRKQQRLRSAAMLYLQSHPTCLQPRFDVVDILASEGISTRDPEITHLKNAF